MSRRRRGGGIGTVTGNTSSDPGGVVYADSGSITFSGDTVTHNSSDSEGGAIYDYEGNLTL
jgi:predicted outer membrane repeat protein